METNQEGGSATIGRLAAGIVHEMNTPLGALRSASDTLARMVTRLGQGCTDAEQAAGLLRAPVAVIAQGTERIAEVVRLLEQLERTLDHTHSQRVVLDLRTALGRVLARASDTLDERVRIECRFDGRPTPVRCNQSRLEGALGDLLEHAASSLDNGGEVTLCVERLGSHAEVWIADDGPGMSEAEVAAACALGFAARDGRVRLHLGLAACKQAIESEGGELHIESTPGAGTQLRIRLPIATSPSDAIPL